MDTSTVDINRKRQLFILCVSVGVPVIIGIAITDYFEGDTLELVIDLAIGAVLVAALIAIKLSQLDLIIYRTGLILVSVGLLYAVSIGAGAETVLYWLFFVPLMFFFFLGKSEGLGWSIVFFGALAALLLAPFVFATYPYSIEVGSRFLISFLFVVIVAYGIESSRHKFSQMLTSEHNKLLAEKSRLEAALKEIKALSGLLPICASCKKIRDDEGYWHQVEIYIRNHSDADFSHGICPECAEELYPEFFGEK